MSPAPRLAACLLALAPALHGAAAQRQVTIAPAPVERAAMVVTLTLPREFADGAILRDERGQPVPLQAEADLTAKFIVARQAAGQTLRFTLEPGRTPDQGNVQVVEEPSPPRPGAAPGIATAAGASLIQGRTGRLRVSVGGRPILYYQMDKDAVPREDVDPKLRRAGYLHPVLTPRGVTVTEDYPKDDPTQHGISTLWRDLQYRERKLDFGDPKGQGGRIELGGIDRTWSGPVSGGFASWHRWVESDNPGATEVLNESWELNAYALPAELKVINLFDLTVTQTVPTNESLAIKPGKDGFMIRTPPGWNPKLNGRGANLPTDQGGDPGGQDLVIQGQVGDATAGIVILFPRANPLNAYWVVHDLLPADERERLFGNDRLPLRSGRPLEMRQRVVTFDGPPDEALIWALWAGYNVPPVVSISAP